eukprot:m.17108 g.17108  ORF g.17108 m.17108 type:complete len:161 (+) comp10649_c1_seq1:45-527(+)
MMFKIALMISLSVAMTMAYGEQECWMLLWEEHCTPYEHCVWVPDSLGGICYRREVTTPPTTSTTYIWDSCWKVPPGPNCPLPAIGGSSDSSSSKSGNNSATTIVAVCVGVIAFCALVAVIALRYKKPAVQPAVENAPAPDVVIAFEQVQEQAPAQEVVEL